MGVVPIAQAGFCVNVDDSGCVMCGCGCVHDGCAAGRVVDVNTISGACMLCVRVCKLCLNF